MLSCAPSPRRLDRSWGRLLHAKTRAAASKTRPARHRTRNGTNGGFFTVGPQELLKLETKPQVRVSTVCDITAAARVRLTKAIRFLPLLPEIREELAVCAKAVPGARRRAGATAGHLRGGPSAVHRGSAKRPAPRGCPAPPSFAAPPRVRSAAGLRSRAPRRRQTHPAACLGPAPTPRVRKSEVRGDFFRFFELLGAISSP